MTNLTPNQTYTLTGSDIYLCQSTRHGLALRDLNRSRVWRDDRGNPSGFVSGYLVKEDKLYYCAYDLHRGKRVRQEGPVLSRHKAEELQPCGVRVHTWGVNEWWQSGHEETSRRKQP